MARKHGGVQTGFRPVLSSSSRAFARRGDPWATDREGIRSYGRNPELENPDKDADDQRHQLNQARNKQIIEDQFDELSKTKPTVGKQSSIFGKKYHRDWKGRQRDVDFVVEEKGARRRRLLGLARTINYNDHLPSSQISRTHEASRVTCAYGCGFSHEDSRMVARHHRAHPNACCTHSKSCNCPDCRRSRNEL